MRHRKAGKKLNRSPSHRKAMFRNMAMALFRHERIVTTVAKAKALRPFVEKLITLGKKGDLHSRRLAISRMGPAGNAEVKPSDGKDDKDADDRTVIQKLFEDIGPRFADRPGGYTRIVKRHERRLGDAGHTAFLELLKEGEEKVMRERAATAAPAVEQDEDDELEDEDDELEDDEQEEKAEGEDEDEDEDDEDEDEEDKDEEVAEKDEKKDDEKK